jgi:hypothetical protein
LNEMVPMFPLIHFIAILVAMVAALMMAISQFPLTISGSSLRSMRRL